MVSHVLKPKQDHILEDMGWIHCGVPRDDAKVRLFCFPHAGGSGYEYQKWAGLAGMDNIEVSPPSKF